MVYGRDRRTAIFFNPGSVEVDQPTELVTVKAIDISNHQPTGQQLVDLLQQYGAEHVIVRLPQSVESRELYRKAESQISTIGNMGLSYNGYGWLYQSENPAKQANDWMDFLKSLGLEVPYIFIDVEPYLTNDNLPNIKQIKVAAQTLLWGGQPTAIYTGPWVWSLLRNVVDDFLPTLPLWTAEYNEIPTLTDVTLYGGWTSCMAHQYSDKGVDQNMFDKAYTVK